MNTIASDHDNSGLRDAFRVAVAGIVALWLREPARQGNARAQEMLGFMHALGTSMFPGVNRDGREAIHWFDLAARQGEPVSLRMYCALRRQFVSNVPPAARCLTRAGVTGGRDWLPLAPAPTARSEPD
ncbi:MAG: hypothetical protein M9907_10965 [Burkholderiaceae bacterium]|nr:hypothetical protein [Burkholderiaceae bacterium]